jgi:hypothetical protein
MSDAFAPHMEATARHFFGEPNRALSSKRELRFGRHGSLSVDIEAGVWTDHEAKEAAGVLDLVERQARVRNGARLEYLREKVGVDLVDERPPLAKRDGPARVAQTYDYTDEAGTLIFQVCRMEPKGFRQRRPEGQGWSWSVKGVRPVPYRLVDLIDAVEAGMTVFVVEGEKDADALWALGVPATCNAGGAGKWPPELGAWFSGARVVILPDNDDAGRNHRDIVGAGLAGVAAEVRVLELPGLPPKGDASDWLAAGGSRAALEALAEEAPAWRPTPPVTAFNAVLWADIARMKPRTDWSVRGLLFPQDLGLIYGESQAGKSFLSVNLALSIARGRPFFEMETRPGAVAYQAGEGQQGLASRFNAHRLHHQITDEPPVLFIPSRVNFYADDAAPFIDEMRAWKAWFGSLAAIFIDTLNAAASGANENASEDVSRILDRAHELKAATGAAVIFVHHKNAGGVKPAATPASSPTPTWLLMSSATRRADIASSRSRRSRTAKAEGSSASGCNPWR